MKSFIPSPEGLGYRLKVTRFAKVLVIISSLFLLSNFNLSALNYDCKKSPTIIIRGVPNLLETLPAEFRKLQTVKREKREERNRSSLLAPHSSFSKGYPGSGWVEDIPVCTFPYDEQHISMATDSSNNIYCCYTSYHDSLGILIPRADISKDGGKTWENILYGRIPEGGIGNHRYPQITVDPFMGYLYVSLEYEYSSDDHDIYLLRSTNAGSTWYYIKADVDGDDDRFPSSACEYYGLGVNWVHITYEYIHNNDDRDLMWMYWEVQNEQWQKFKLHGGWSEEHSDWVYCNPNICIGNIGEGAYTGYAYITYEHKKDYDSTGLIYIDRLKWDGYTGQWNLYQSFYLDSVLTNNSRHPVVGASRNGALVTVAYEYDFYGDGTDWDIHYIYSTDTGETWIGKNFLAAEEGAECHPSLIVDGQGSMSTSIGGYINCVYTYDGSVCFKRTHSDTPECWKSWDGLKIDNSGNTSICSTRMSALTNRKRDGIYIPCIGFIDKRDSNPNVYYTTKGVNLTFLTIPDDNPPFILIDSIQVSTPDVQTFWPGDSILISAPSPQYSEDSLIKYNFNYWDDEGEQTHIIVAGNNNATITAYFDTTYFGIEDSINSQLSTINYQLSVYPNPFTTVVSVQCSGISEGQKIDLQIYDLSGRLVKSLPFITNHSPLTTAVSWDGADESGKKVTSGLYFAKLTPKLVKKIVVIR